MSGEFVIKYSLCANNTADMSGGCVHDARPLGHESIIYKTNIISNIAFHSGGGIYTNAHYLKISHCIISGNEVPAGLGGGG